MNKICTKMLILLLQKLQRHQGPEVDGAGLSCARSDKSANKQSKHTIWSKTSGVPGVPGVTGTLGALEPLESL